jgi:hypothetical protein
MINLEPPIDSSHLCTMTGNNVYLDKMEAWPTPQRMVVMISRRDVYKRLSLFGSASDNRHTLP